MIYGPSDVAVAGVLDRTCSVTQTKGIRLTDLILKDGYLFAWQLFGLLFICCLAQLQL